MPALRVQIPQVIKAGLATGIAMLRAITRPASSTRATALPAALLAVAESGLRPGRDAQLRALKGRIIGCVGCPPNCRTSGKPRGSSDLLELLRKMLH